MNSSSKNATQLQYYFPNSTPQNIHISDFNSVMQSHSKNTPTSNSKNYKTNDQWNYKTASFGLEPIQQLVYPKYLQGNMSKRQMNTPKAALTYEKKQELKSKLSLKNQLESLHSPTDKKNSITHLKRNVGSPKQGKKPEYKLVLKTPQLDYENTYYPKNFRQEVQFHYPEQTLDSSYNMKRSFIAKPTNDNQIIDLYQKNIHANPNLYYPNTTKKSMIISSTQNNAPHLKKDMHYQQQHQPGYIFVNPQKQYSKNKNIYDEARSVKTQGRNINDIGVHWVNQYNKNSFGSTKFSINNHGQSNYHDNIESQHNNPFENRLNGMTHYRHDRIKTSMIMEPSDHMYSNKHSNSLSLQKNNQIQSRIPHNGSFTNLPDFLLNRQQAYQQLFEVKKQKNPIASNNKSCFQIKSQQNSQKDLFNNTSSNNNSPKMNGERIEMKHFQGNKMNIPLNQFISKKKEQIALKRLNQAKIGLHNKDKLNKKQSLKHKKNTPQPEKKQALALLKEQYSHSKKNSPFSINPSSPTSSNNEQYYSLKQGKINTHLINEKNRKGSYQWKSNIITPDKPHKNSWENQMHHSPQDFQPNTDVYIDQAFQFSFLKKPKKKIEPIPVEEPSLGQKKKSRRFSQPPSILLGFEFNQPNSKQNNRKNNMFVDKKLKNSKILNQTADTRQSSNYYHQVPQINDFQVGKQLGRGKFGVVNMAVHKKTRLLFALKTLSKKSIKKEKVYDQIIREVKIQYFMNYPHLVKLYGIFDDKENIYLLLEYCTDGQLYQILQNRKKFNQVDACIVMKQLCQGIAQLHRNNVIHRDMKPQNVVVNFGMCKICDFGWSIYSQNKQQLRQTLCGTPLYFSPELITEGSYNQKVDLWALGMMAYQLMNGDIPFDIKSQDQLIKIATSDIVYPPSMSLQAIQFIKLLLERNPDKRVNIEKVLNHKFFDTYHKQSQSSRSRSAAKLMNHK